MKPVGRGCHRSWLNTTRLGGRRGTDGPTHQDSLAYQNGAAHPKQDTPRTRNPVTFHPKTPAANRPCKSFCIFAAYNATYWPTNGPGKWGGT